MKISLTKQELHDLSNSSNDPYKKEPDVWVTQENEDRAALFVLSFNNKTFTFEVEVTD